MIMKLKEEPRAHEGCRASEQKEAKVMSLCLINKAQRHEDVWENEDTAPPFLEVSGQLHAPDVLPPKKKPPVPIG
jgi:hypothetical protein